MGLLGAVALTRFIRGMLFGITPLDLPTFGAIPIGVTGVTMLAAYIAARKASTIAPASALGRTE